LVVVIEGWPATGVVAGVPMGAGGVVAGNPAGPGGGVVESPGGAGVCGAPCTCAKARPPEPSVIARKSAIINFGCAIPQFRPDCHEAQLA
jgi:hypothetical protein